MTASNRRIGELINDIEEGRLNIRPAFQRRLVWTNTNKEQFIDTVLQGYPFPEIFVGNGELDINTSKRTNWLVDGQQRISTLRDYFKGTKEILCKTIPAFSTLSPEEKTRFLDYVVAVRDLGTIGEAKIKEIFKRINSTDYALKSMEKLNAMFSGAYNQYCEQLSRHEFFARHNTFSQGNIKRMYDVTFCVILVTTLQAGYYRRDEKNREYLERYNDDFPHGREIDAALEVIFAFIDTCAFRSDSRAWKQTDLFTLLVELHSLLIISKLQLDPIAVGARLGSFFDRIDELYSGEAELDPEDTDHLFRYLKASTKATNDKYARTQRAEIVSSLILDVTTNS
jgi:hypothetical protein